MAALRQLDAELAELALREAAARRRERGKAGGVGASPARGALAEGGVAGSGGAGGRSFEGDEGKSKW